MPIYYYGRGSGTSNLDAATRLSKSVTINGVSFDGSKNIVIPMTIASNTTVGGITALLNGTDLYIGTSGTTTSATAPADTTAPTAVITTSAPTVTVGDQLTALITFSEAVTGLTASDLTAVNATIGSVTGTGGTYSVNLTSTTVGTGSITLGANTVVDASGNYNTASASATFTIAAAANTGTYVVTATPETGQTTNMWTLSLPTGFINVSVIQAEPSNFVTVQADNGAGAVVNVVVIVGTDKQPNIYSQRTFESVTGGKIIINP
jgi:hypothetical protein